MVTWEHLTSWWVKKIGILLVFIETNIYLSLALKDIQMHKFIGVQTNSVRHKKNDKCASFMKTQDAYN